VTYNPFKRGAAPVGVRSLVLRDSARDGREVPIELWHPADRTHAGEDLDVATQDRFKVASGLPRLTQRAVRGARPAGGRLPLLLYFHGSTRHRRDATELCTHLASHGYVVAAPDFEGNTLADQVHDMTRQPGENRRLKTLAESAVDRPLDARLVLDRLVGAVDRELARTIDAETVGTFGISFGGWTSIALNCIDDRPRATFAIVPAWGPGPVGTEMLASLVRLKDWHRIHPTFVLAAERDAFVMLPSIRQLFADLPAPKRMAVLRNAGHVHFGDDPETFHETMRLSSAVAAASGVFPFDFKAIAEASRPFAELCPAWHGDQTVKALCLAQMDCHLQNRGEARAFLDDLSQPFATGGIQLEVD
jgi:predicted dienelactone hydrolase